MGMERKETRNMLLFPETTRLASLYLDRHPLGAQVAP